MKDAIKGLSFLGSSGVCDCECVCVYVFDSVTNMSTMNPASECHPSTENAAAQLRIQALASVSPSMRCG